IIEVMAHSPQIIRKTVTPTQLMQTSSQLPSATSRTCSPAFLRVVLWPMFLKLRRKHFYRSVYASEKLLTLFPILFRLNEVKYMCRRNLEGTTRLQLRQDLQ